MHMPVANRRIVLTGLGALYAGLALPGHAKSAGVLHVVKDPDCGCCSAWIEIMQAAGFETDVQDTTWDELSRFKASNGVPRNMASCHTGLIDGYVIEGHVPPEDVHRLLAERPDAIGLAVPGMPLGSPGMGPASEREAYSVYMLHRDGRFSVFAQYEAG